MKFEYSKEKYMYNKIKDLDDFDYDTIIIKEVVS